MSVTQEQMLNDCADYLESCGVDLDDVIDDKDTLIEDWVVDHSTVSLASLVTAADREGVDLEDAIVTVDNRTDWDGYPETAIEIRHASSSKGNTEEQLSEVLDYIQWRIVKDPSYREYKAAFKLMESVSEN